MRRQKTIEKRVQQIAASLKYSPGGKLQPSRRRWDARGTFRNVILDDGVVYKVADYKQYSEMNRSEWNRYYLQFPKAVLPLCAKPLAISDCGCVIAMERIEHLVGTRFPPNCDRDDVLDDFRMHLRQLFEDNGEDPFDWVSDLHSHNAGVDSSGALVWIDYADNNV